MFLKRLELENYCGFEKLNLDFKKNVSILYGQNGNGKSTILNAISKLSNPWRFMGNRSPDLIFRKLTFNEEYDPTYSELSLPDKKLEMSGIFNDGVKDFTTKITSTPNWHLHSDEFKKEIKEKNLSYKDVYLKNKLSTVETSTDLKKKNYSQGYSFFTDADNPMEMRRFQIDSKYKDQFLDFTKAVYGMETYLDKIVEEESPNGEKIIFYTDFIIDKHYRGTKVHFKSFSAGEAKIATLLSSVFSSLHNDNTDIYLIDNLSMHIYYKRHGILIDKLLEHFPNKQIIATDHSGVLIEYCKDHKKCETHELI